MSHKAAKKARKLLNETMGASQPTGNVWQGREYDENARRRKKELVELKTGEQKEIEVSLGQLTLRPGTGRAVYKVLKGALMGKGPSQRQVRAPIANRNKGAELLTAPEPVFIEDVQG